MATINFTGNLGADAKLEYTPNGLPKLSFSVADTKSRPIGDGKWEKLAEQWLRCTVWGGLGQHLADEGKLTKGARVEVSGEFYAREFEHNGEKRTSLDVNVLGVRVLPKREPRVNAAPDAWAPDSYEQRTRQPRPAQQQRQDDPWGAPQQTSPTEPPF